MQPITIAALCIAAIAIVTAAVAMECATRDRAARKAHARALLREQEAHGNLKIAHLRLGSSYAEAESHLAAERADHATTRGKLARMDASQRPRATGGRFGAKVAA